MCKHKTRTQNTSTISPVVTKSYLVSARTAEAIRRLSFEHGETEGRIIDKIVRTYLATFDLNGLGNVRLGGECNAE